MNNTSALSRRSLPFAAASALFAALLLALPEVGASGISRGLDACYEVVIPSLFPFLFLTDALRSSLAGGSRAVEVGAALSLGLVGGFPVGARGLGGCAKSGALSRESASALLAGAVNAGPAFLITGVGLRLLGSARAGLLLFIALTFASVLTALASLLIQRFRQRGKHQTSKRGALKVEAQKAASFVSRANSAALTSTAHEDHSEKTTRTHELNSPLSNRAKAAEPQGFSLARSLSFAVEATVSLCGYVTLFSGVCAYLALALDALAVTALVKALCFSALEVTSGCAAAAETGGTAGLYLACAAVSACGGCVLAQVRGICREAGISMRLFFALRPLHLALSLLSLKALLSLGGEALPASLTLSGPARAFSYSASSAAALFALCVAFLLCERRFNLFTKR